MSNEERQQIVLKNLQTWKKSQEKRKQNQEKRKESQKKALWNAGVHFLSKK